MSGYTEVMVQHHFGMVKRSKFIFEDGKRLEHTFSNSKGGIANFCNIKRGGFTFDGKTYIVLSIAWSNPHFFFINTSNNDILWVMGEPKEVLEDIMSEHGRVLYREELSVSTWLETLQTMAEKELITKWAMCGRFIPKEKISEL